MHLTKKVFVLLEGVGILKDSVEFHGCSRTMSWRLGHLYLKLYSTSIF